MGACKVDLTEKGRQYSVQYALNDAAGVKKLLTDRHKIASRRFNGDTDASAILLDLHSAIETAGLTARQAEAIAWVYGKDVTQAEAARIMCVGQDSVSDFVNGAAKRIAAVYQRWEYGEITIELTDEMEVDV